MLSPQDRDHPIIYVISSGETTEHDLNSGTDVICHQARAAARAGVQLFQIREKNLSAGALFDLASKVVQAAADSGMKVLVNDRADVAAAAGAHGVHLTSVSMDAAVLRGVFGDRFIIGVSAHNEQELLRARSGGADFATFSPVYETESKKEFGPPQGMERLSSAVSAASPMPVIALGGITPSNARVCIEAGAAGVAGIGLFRDVDALESVVSDLRKLRCQSGHGKNG